MVLSTVVLVLSFAAWQPPSPSVGVGVGRLGRPLLQDASLSQGGALAQVGTQLEQALGALPADQKYNAVLISLLSKKGSQESSTASAIELVQEMSAKRLQLSEDALKALLDLAVEDGEVEKILESMQAARKNGACRAFASPQLQLPTKPAPSALGTLTPVPADERSSELGVAAAVVFGSIALLLDELADSLDSLLPIGDVSAPPIQFVFAALAVAWGVDRYIQQGALFGLVGRGWARLFTRDLQRECAVESASFLLGYLLGLPCCTFTPTAIKPLDMLTKVGAPMAEGVSSPPRLIDRVLIWLMAPAAIESAQYSETLQSDPGLASTFLSAARRREALGVDVEQGGWSTEEDEQRVRWAYSEAKRLLQRYSGVREELQERMAAGVSAGDCVALIESKLKNTWAAV